MLSAEGSSNSPKRNPLPEDQQAVDQQGAHIPRAVVTWFPLAEPSCPMSRAGAKRPIARVLHCGVSVTRSRGSTAGSCSPATAVRPGDTGHTGPLAGRSAIALITAQFGSTGSTFPPAVTRRNRVSISPELTRPSPRSRSATRRTWPSPEPMANRADLPGDDA